MATEEGTGTLGINDILSGLADEKPETPEKTEDKEDLELEVEDEEEIKDEPEEKSEDEDDEEEEPEPEIKLEDKDVDEYAEIPTRQAVKKKYPEFFKEFPGVERAIYREQAYTEVFASVKDAKEAREAINQYNEVESDLRAGKIDGLLASVKQANPTAFGKIAGTLLKQVADVDKDSYYGIVNTITKHSLNSAMAAAKSMGGEDGEQLAIAAQLMHKFIYGTPKVTPYSMPVPDDKEDPKAKELSDKERNFNSQQLSIAVKDVTSRIESSVKTAVEKAIDPRGAMSDYIKSKAVEDVMNSLDRIIGSDKRFSSYRDELWKEAIKEGYSDTAKAKIRRAVINKAQSLLPDIIRKVRADAVKGLGSKPGRPKKYVPDEDSVKPNKDRRQASSNKERNQGNKPTRVGNVNSVLKFLED